MGRGAPPLTRTTRDGSCCRSLWVKCGAGGGGIGGIGGGRRGGRRFAGLTAAEVTAPPRSELLPSAPPGGRHSNPR